MPAKAAEKYGTVLKRLDLSDNLIRNGATLKGMNVLDTLILDKNDITALKVPAVFDLGFCFEGFNLFSLFFQSKKYPVMPSVTCISLNNNKLDDLEAIVQQIDNFFPNVEVLSMLFNPCCPNIYMDPSAEDAYQRYRYYTIKQLKKLTALDSVNVTPQERKEAEAKAVKIAKAPSPTSAAAAAATAPTQQVSTSHPKVATFLARAGIRTITVSPRMRFLAASINSCFVLGKPRYDGTNSEGNRFILNDDL